MIEINRWLEGERDGNVRDPVPNPEFIAIFDGEKLDRSPLLECSGRYEGCYLYNGVVYENWVNWGFDCLFRLDQDDLKLCHQDREGRVGETLKPCLMGACTDIIRGTLPL
jgi:hypothetical protein